jgi:hypothetical protein
MKKTSFNQSILKNFAPLTRNDLRQVKGGEELSSVKCYSDASSGYDPVLKVSYSGTCGKSAQVMADSCECQTTSGNFYHEACQASPE